MEHGLVHIYHGDGKGKTTAAMGLALRALGCGWRVAIVQFLKGRPSGEITILEQMSGVLILRGRAGTKFSVQMNEAEREEARALHHTQLAEAMETAERQAYDLLILDEALDACGCGLLDEALLRKAIAQRPPKLELVLTGRNPSQAVLDLADYVTEMKLQKHPYEQGILARRGVEF